MYEAIDIGRRTGNTDIIKTHLLGNNQIIHIVYPKFIMQSLTIINDFCKSRIDVSLPQGIENTTSKRLIKEKESVRQTITSLRHQER